jgi:hypothetical protein
LCWCSAVYAVVLSVVISACTASSIGAHTITSSVYLLLSLGKRSLIIIVIHRTKSNSLNGNNKRIERVIWCCALAGDMWELISKKMVKFSLGLSATASVIRFGQRTSVLLLVDYAAWSSVLRQTAALVSLRHSCTGRFTRCGSDEFLLPGVQIGQYAWTLAIQRCRQEAGASKRCLDGRNSCKSGVRYVCSEIGWDLFIRSVGYFL